MRVVTRYSVIFFPSSCISKSATRAHLMPRTVLAASATAFSAALAKLSLEDPTISMTFCGMDDLLLLSRSISLSEGCTYAEDHERDTAIGWRLNLTGAWATIYLAQRISFSEKWIARLV